MKDLERMALLIDFYGPLLTPRQQELVRAYFLDDFSLGEIAEGEGVSRQAVHDQIKRAEAALQETERRLGLVAEHLRRQQVLERAQDHLRQAQAGLPAGSAAAVQVAAARRLIQDLLISTDPPADRG